MLSINNISQTICVAHASRDSLEPQKKDFLLTCTAFEVRCALRANRSRRTTGESRRIKSANVIKKFLRKAIAARTYQKMFSQGLSYRPLRIQLEPHSAGRFSFNSIDHLNDVSSAYLKGIKAKIENHNPEGKSLLPEERALLSRVADAKLYFRHQSNLDLANKSLNIFSLEKLQARGNVVSSLSNEGDTHYLMNNDFVFLALSFQEMSHNSHLIPNIAQPIMELTRT